MSSLQYPVMADGQRNSAALLQLLHQVVQRGCLRLCNLHELLSARIAASVVDLACAMQESATRRQALLGVAAAVAVLAPREASAFLGIGEDTGKIYNDDTVCALVLFV